jgi:hypothetical protein
MSGKIDFRNDGDMIALSQTQEEFNIIVGIIFCRSDFRMFGALEPETAVVCFRKTIGKMKMKKIGLIRISQRDYLG